MKPESWSSAFILAFGFVAGASMVSYLVMTDPEVRIMFKAKAARVQEGHWSGISREVARHVIAELYDAFPDIFKAARP